VPETPKLDVDTLRAVIAMVEHRMTELDRQTAHCPSCGSRELKDHLDHLRMVVASQRKG
jgi:hypothetical protein